MFGKVVLFLTLLSVLFSGCIGVGENTTYCQENGCDYSDAGVCGNSFDIYKNYKKVEKKAYSDYACKD